MYTLGDIPRKGYALHRNRTAMVFEGTRITYGMLEDRVNRLANALIGLGLRKGGRVTILAENTYKYMEVYFGAAKAGLSVTPLNFRLSDKELTYIVNDCEATVFFAGDGLEERGQALLKSLTGIEHFVFLNRKGGGIAYYEELLESASNADPLIEVDENEMAILMYTGGTTGLPKGVMLSHRNIMTAHYGLALGNSFTQNDCVCFSLPMFHVSLWPILCHLMVGGKSVILRRPDLGEILKAIYAEKCTHLLLVPTVLTWLVEDPRTSQADLSSLRLITYAGSPMPIDVLRKCIDRFGPILSQGYGLTEAAPLVSIHFKEDHILEGPRSRLLSSVGKVGVFVEAKVVDVEDRTLLPGEVGEICIRGKNVMMGYWKNPNLTAKTLRGWWLHTGDVGMIDDEGFIFLMDRKADMIITGGENVYPAETEDVLYSHSAVRECAVVAAPDKKWGERVQAVVVLKDGCSVTKDELIKHCKDRLAGYKCPKSIDFWSELPKERRNYHEL
ncbi:MAG: long-chain-fatty-acid--CoA ligase [Thermodesulfobacteriota bacterium]